MLLYKISVTSSSNDSHNMYCIKLVKLSHRHKRVFFCESIAVKINVNDLYTTGKPYVWKTCLISPPRVLSYKKNGGVLIPIPLRRNWKLTL